MKYIRQLDTIRGVGILLVIAFHWLPIDSFHNTFPNRPFGVDVFFVLSGYLITTILFNAREAISQHNANVRSAYAGFIVSRALRIFPLYYLVILIMMMVHGFVGAQLSADLLPALTFTTNFHFYNRQYWGDLSTHLWTMAVEEQFYLVWPWVIFGFSRRYLPFVISIFILIGVISQCLITDMEFGYLPTQTCLDAFGIGALVAWIAAYKPGMLPAAVRFLSWAGAIAMAMLIVGAAWPDLIFLAPQRTLRSLVAAWAIAFVVLKDREQTVHQVWFFNNRVLMFIGKISYGMYLYHIFFPWLYPFVNAPLHGFLGPAFDGWLIYLTFIENVILLVVVSWLSYRVFEKPITRWKKYITQQKVSSISRAAVAN